MASGSIAAAAKNLVHTLENAIKCDSWGQVLEAAAEYKKFHSDYHEGLVNFSMDDAQEKQLNTITEHIRRRADHLMSNQTLLNRKEIPLDQLKTDLQALREIVENFQSNLNRRHSSIAVVCGDNLLLPPPKKKRPGCTYATIKIEKIGLKDVDHYTDPFFTISVKDRSGRDLAPVQHTPPSYNIHDRYIVFDMNVHFPTPLEDFDDEYAIFFELKHFKEKKDKVSTRCFALAEKDEIKPGYSAIELYKKPVDYSRKKLYLFTEKPLYLHLFYSLD